MEKVEQIFLAAVATVNKSATVQPGQVKPACRNRLKCQKPSFFIPDTIIRSNRCALTSHVSEFLL
jgi:hypothetical protein